MGGVSLSLSLSLSLCLSLPLCLSPSPSPSPFSRILDTCDVQLYRQMGGLRDDLAIHERALDILIELMKKEQLDESVPLHGLEKAIGHFEVRRE